MDPAAAHTLYRFFTGDGELLYIGLTCNPPRRLVDHKKGKPWWVDVTRIELESFPNRAKCAAAEAEAIQNERPRYNIHERWRDPAALVAVVEANNKFEAAKANRTALIRKAAASGMSYRKIAAIVGLSHQRVQQIVAGGR